VTAYVRPRDLDEARRLRAEHPDWMLLAGGTDLMVNARHHPLPVGILDGWRIPGHFDIRAAGGQVEIGGGATWREIAEHRAVVDHIPILAAAAREIGALQIQTRGTLGGNVATSSPVGDSLPVLLALDASVELGSVRGTRVVPYREFCTGYRKTQLAADELIVRARIPLPSAGTRLHWRKVGTRRAQSISKVMAAAAVVLDGDRIVSAALALGAVADRPIRLVAVEAALAGQRQTEAVDTLRQLMPSVIHPISDIRSTADYRLDVATNLLARFFS
jgi:CO/xanthine dehydrogenase FAD-binding subunit